MPKPSFTVLQINDVKPGHPNHARRYFLHENTFGDLVKKVSAKREPDARLCSMTIHVEAGFQKGAFSYVDIYNGPDFPR
jgi:predicted nucleotidyltransferase